MKEFRDFGGISWFKRIIMDILQQSNEIIARIIFKI